MNQYLSAIVLKNGDIIYNPEFQHIEISDDFARTNEFVRVKFSRYDDLSEIFDVIEWELEIDELQAPDWFNEIYELKVYTNLANRVEEMFVQDKRNLLEGGCWILGEGADVEVVKDARVWGMFGNARIETMKGSSQVEKMHDSSRIKRMLDSSRVGVMYETSQIEIMYNTSQVGEMRISSRIKQMLDSSRVGTMYNTSRVERMLDSSQVKYARNSSLIEKMYNSSRIERLGGSSQVKVMRDTSEINFIHTPAKIIIDKR